MKRTGKNTGRFGKRGISPSATFFHAKHFGTHDATTAETTPFFQPALTIGQPNDKYEREADTVADKVTAGNSAVPLVQQQPISQVQKADLQEQTALQRQPEKEEEEPVQKAAEKEEEAPVQMAVEKEEEEPLQKQTEKEEEEPVQAQQEEEEEAVQAKSVAGYDRSGAGFVSTQLGRQKGSGDALPTQPRQYMEASFGTSFDGVKIHTDSTAVQMNKAIGAKAFTHGKDIYFNSGYFAPHTHNGRHLLAHELTHVVQQTQSINETVQRKISYDLTKIKLEDPIPKIIGRGGKLGEIYIIINGKKLITKEDAIKSIFEAFNHNLSLIHDGSKKECKPDLSNLIVTIGAEITHPTDPVNDKWSGSYPGQIVSGSPKCSKLSLVNIEMLSSPSGGIALKKNVIKQEAQHFIDIIDLSEKHIETFHNFLENLVIPTNTAAECPEKFSKAIGDKDIIMATAFADDWLAAVHRYDNPSGSHHYKSITDARNCNLITITVQF